MRLLFQGQNPNFRVITLKEPPKKEMIRFLKQENCGQLIDPPPPRNARVQVVVRSKEGSNQLIEFVVDLELAAVVKQEHLVGRHSYIDAAYMRAVEVACMTDERVQGEIRKLELPAKASVCVEPWAYATDGMNNMSERITMVGIASYCAL